MFVTAAVLMVVAVGGASAVAKSSPAVTFSPGQQKVSPGGTATFSFKVRRDKRSKAPTVLAVSGLPPRATARWTLPGGGAAKLRRRTLGTAVLAARVTRGQLAVAVPASVGPQMYRPVVTISVGRQRRRTSVTLTIEPAPTNVPAPVSPAPRAPTPAPAGLPPASTATLPALALEAAPRTIRVPRGGRTSVAITLTRNFFSGPVTLAVRGLPAGTVGSFTAGTAGSADALTVTAAADAALGGRAATITASGDGLEASTEITLFVEESVSVDIAGDVAAPLRPGSREPIDVVVINPHERPISLVTLDVALSTSQPGCNAAVNYRVTPYAGRLPLSIPPGSTALEALTTREALPTLAMLDLPEVNQDACKGARLRLDYVGTALP